MFGIGFELWWLMSSFATILCEIYFLFRLFQPYFYATAYRLSNVLLTVCPTSLFKIFLYMQHHYFCRFVNHVGRCHLLLSNCVIQPIRRSSALDYWSMGRIPYPYQARLYFSRMIWIPTHPLPPLPSLSSTSNEQENERETTCWKPVPIPVWGEGDKCIENVKKCTVTLHMKQCT